MRLHSCFDSRLSKLPKKRPPTSSELEAEIISLMTDTERADSLASTLNEVFRVGNSVRERLSSDMTRLIGQLNDCVQVQEYMLFVEYSVGAYWLLGTSLRVFRHGAREHYAGTRLALP